MVLNNEACTLQQLEDHAKALSYVEAIIYQIQSFLEEEHVGELMASLKQFCPRTALESLTAKAHLLTTYLDRQQDLGLYLLRFSGLQALTGDFEGAIESGKESLKAMKQLFLVCQLL